MSLEVCVLGSGSSGNSTVVRSGWGSFLIDAGFGPRVSAERLHGIGMSPEDIAAIVLTHLDSDHFNGNWLRTIVKLGIRIYCARKRVREFLALPEVRDLEMKLAAKEGMVAGRADAADGGATGIGTGWSLEGSGRERGRVAELVTGFDGPFEPVKNVRLHPLALAHDEAGSHGFVAECEGYRVGFATDLGHVPAELIERFCGVDVLALESNYDPEMERTSDRPWYLKQRIMGGRGHLSNEQALEAVRAILDRTAETCGADRLPRHIVLLHRSRQCNCPELVRRLFESDPRISPVLTLTHQHERTAWLHAGRPRAVAGRQMVMSWG